MQTACDAGFITGFWDDSFADWRVLCVIGLMIGFLSISLLYMVSKLFDRPSLSAWCRNEFYQIAMTAIIVVGIVGFVQFMCMTITPSLFGLSATPDTLYQGAHDYLVWLRDKVYWAYTAMAGLNVLLSMLTGIVMQMNPGGIGTGLVPFAGLNEMNGGLIFMMSTTLMALLLMVVQVMMLDLIYLLMFNVYLPLGVFFRCFAPTRDFGGALITLAIGLYIFYPFLLLLNAVALQGGTWATELQTDFNDKASDISLEDAGLANILETYEDVTVDADFDNPGPTPPIEVEGATEFYSTEKMPQLVGKYGAAIASGIRIYSGIVLNGALFLPALNFILLIIFVRDLGRFFGEDMDITNVTRLI